MKTIALLLLLLPVSAFCQGYSLDININPIYFPNLNQTLEDSTIVTFTCYCGEVDSSVGSFLHAKYQFFLLQHIIYQEFENSNLYVDVSTSFDDFQRFNNLRVDASFRPTCLGLLNHLTPQTNQFDENGLLKQASKINELDKEKYLFNYTIEDKKYKRLEVFHNDELVLSILLEYATIPSED